ncbi:glycoside hydrolase family 5 protein [Dothistroma septosporum NZE10]|uniref:Glycoside hydrolase family 5 protein n=1 Tax=Dothistroma septosporum (strain NZE10 / CBS 128990) TaxID=675120 RepID=N1PDU1_DOTSN|nr:glycoside hydrolase family 5 protein [Dothistroma septosporum NZE10]
MHETRHRPHDCREWVRTWSAREDMVGTRLGGWWEKNWAMIDGSLGPGGRPHRHISAKPAGKMSTGRDNEISSTFTPITFQSLPTAELRLPRLVEDESKCNIETIIDMACAPSRQEKLEPLVSKGRSSYRHPAIAGLVSALPSSVLQRREDRWPYAPFTTSGRDIKNTQGETVTNAGANWPGDADSMLPEGLQYQSVANIVSKIKSLGMDTIRLTYAIEMVDDIYSDNIDSSLEGTFVNALGQENGTKVFSQFPITTPSSVRTLPDSSLLLLKKNIPSTNTFTMPAKRNANAVLT